LPRREGSLLGGKLERCPGYGGLVFLFGESWGS